LSGTSHAVFISYASQDAEASARICEALQAAGIEVWFDQSELRGGDAWDQKIRQQIRDCALFVPIISAHTQARPEGYFRLEWKLAVDRSHLMAAEKAFLVPVVVDATTEPTALVPTQFRDVQWTRIQAGEVPAPFVDRITALLSHPVASRVDRPERAIGRAPARRLPKVLTVLAVTAVVALVIWTAIRGGWLSRRPVPKVEASTTFAPAANAPAMIPDKSVAVLPFVDMSEKKDQEYFSDGMSEELIDMLTRISELRVPARTSSFYFKGKSTTIAEIAKTLRVAYVLEGSVRKSGKTLRVTAQLIKADSGYHVWSDSYDRALNDVFRVQDEIANAVVSALKVTLANPPGGSALGRTSNTEAYEQYLIGRQFLARGGVDNYHRAEEAFRKAVMLDPSFAAAYVGLSDAQYLFEADTGRLSPMEFERVLALANRAIKLAPDLSDGYSERGIDQLAFVGDLRAARADLSRALDLDPKNSVNQRRFGVLQRCLGNLEAAIASARKATDIDPLDAYAWLHLSEAYAASHRYAEAADASVRAVQISPEWPSTIMTLFDVELHQGRAHEVLGSIERLRDPKDSLPYRAMAEFTLGNDLQSRKALDEYIAMVEQQKFDSDRWGGVATVYAWRGERQKALDWLERVASQGNGGIACINSDPFYAELHDDPRFKALLRKLALPE
jgi:adenylate cyclase